MYYKIKVYSAEDSTKRNDFFVKETLPYVNRKVLEEFFQKATCYQVKVTPLPHVTQLKKKYKAWNSIDLESHIREIRFYTLKEHEVEEWRTIATFYKEKPFDIETDYFNNKWYSFCKHPKGYSDKQMPNSILITLCDIKDSLDHDSSIYKEMTGGVSKNGDPFMRGKYSWSYDGFGNVHLNKLIGTHKELVREKLYC